MREVRSRIVAIELLEAVGVLVFCVLFALSITSFNYPAFSTSAGTISISTALFVKMLGALLVLLCLLWDTDVVLALGESASLCMFVYDWFVWCC